MSKQKNKQLTLSRLIDWHHVQAEHFLRQAARINDNKEGKDSKLAKHSMHVDAALLLIGLQKGVDS